MKIYGRRRLIELLCVMIIMTLGMMISTGVAEVYGATTYSYTCERGTVNGSSGPTRFTVPAMDLTGVCCQCQVHMKKGKAKLTRLSNSSDVAKVAYYWGIKKGYDKKGLNTAERERLTRMIQYATDPKSVKDFYYVKHGACKQHVKQALSVKVPDTFFIYRGTPTNGSQDFVAWKDTKPISLTLKKTSTDTSISSTGGYSFAGIKYQVYKSDKKTRVGLLTCKANGTTNTLTGLVKGTYYAKETTTNAYYSKSSAWLKVTVAEGGKGTFKASDTPLRGKVVINKGTTDRNSISAGYDFKGIVYGIYASKSTSSKLLGKLTLNASGKSNTSGNLPIGTRYIREISTNKYYKLSKEWYAVKIKAGSVTTVSDKTIKDDPVKGSVSIVKSIVDGEAPDEVFIFELVNKRNSSIAYRNIKVKGNGVAVKVDVLAGEYILRETDSGDLSDETGDQQITVKPGETVEIKRTNRVVGPGSLQVRKTTDDGGPRSGFCFTVSGVLKNEAELSAEKLMEEAAPRIVIAEDDREYKLDEWQVDVEDLRKLNQAAKDHITGDLNVGISTTVHISSKEEGGEAEDIPVDVELLLRLKEVLWDEESGAFVGKATNRVENSAKGEGYEVTFNDFEWCGAAGPYRDANTGKDHTVLITNDRGYGVDETTGKEGIELAFPGEYTVCEVMTDEQKARYREPANQTLDWDGNGRGSLTFTFRNLAKTTPVRLRKKSIDGKVADIEFCLSGRTAFGESIRKTGTTDEDGCVDFGTVPKGSYVIEETGWDEENYANNHKLEGYDRPAVALDVSGDETEDIVVEFENVPYAGMKLTKRDKSTGMFLPGAEFSVVNVSDNKLEATFKLVEEEGYPQLQMSDNAGGISVRHSTEPTDAKDTKTAGTEEHSSSDDDGDWIEINGLVSGKDYQVIEVDGPLGYGVADLPVEFKAHHDEDAVVRFEDERSSIGTSAVDSATGEHVSMADEDVTIIDTVTYENLIPGKEYRLQGVLMNRTGYLASNDTNDIVPAKDAAGKEIRSEVRFKPDKASGTVKVRFRFDGSRLGGSSLVVYEKLFIGKDPVTSHEDPTDSDQTIEMPQVKTDAVSERTGMKIDNASEEVVICDTVSYTNLREGVRYHISGVLMDKTSGEPVMSGEKEVRSEADFTAESSSGVVTLTFRFDGRDLAGTTAVAFEELSCNGKIVAEHRDIDDPSQTVDIPELGTQAERIARNRIEDVVRYSGLIPGEKYVMCGVLVDRKTARELKGTMSELEFTPEKRSGEVVIPFRISADDLMAGGVDDVVVFERCDLLVDKREEGAPMPVEIASHRDIDDEGQMVSLTEPAKKTRTGDGTRLMWLICMALITGGIAGVITVLHRRRALFRS